MPSASLELQQEWQREADEQGHGMPDHAARDYLRLGGYREVRNGYYAKPTPAYNPTKKEWSAIYYLIYEWDYGGLVSAEPNPEGVDP